MTTDFLDRLSRCLCQLCAAGHRAGRDALHDLIQAARSLRGRIPAFEVLVSLLEGVPESPRALLDALGLVRRLRSATATAGVSGNLQPLADSGPWATTLSGPQLLELVQSLRKRPRKVCKQITEAVSGGQPLDIRILNDLRQAVLWAYGSNDSKLTPLRMPDWVQILRPLLEQQPFDPGGDHEEAQRLSLICRLNPALGLEWCRQALEANGDRVRRMGIRWLPALTTSAEVLQRLGPLVGNVSNDLAHPIAVALSGTGPAPIPRLFELLAGPQDTRRWQASMVLKEMAPHNREVVLPHLPELLGLLPQVSDWILFNLLQILVRLLPPPEQTTPALLAFLQGIQGTDGHATTRRTRILDTLAEVGFPWEVARSTILRFARTDPDTWTRRAAQRCLAKAAPASSEALHALVDCLGDAPNYCPSVGTLFDEIGPAVAGAVPRLIELLGSSRGDLRAEVLRVLLGIGSAALPAAPQLLRLLRERPRGHEWVLRILGNLGSAVPEGLSTILAALDAEDRELRSNAIDALCSYRPPEDIPIPPLLRALSDEGTWNRASVARLLGRLGARAADAVPILRGLLDSPNRWLRACAQSALNQITRAVGRKGPRRKTR